MTCGASRLTLNPAGPGASPPMPLSRTPASDAFATARANPQRHYPSPDKDGARLYPVASPTSRPGFCIHRSDKIFAIGSCFARNIERALSQEGFDVLSRHPDLGAIANDKNHEVNYFNKYNTFSMLNELGWAFDRCSFDPERIIQDLSDDLLCDLQIGSARLDATRADATAFRHRYLDHVMRVADAGVVVVTLGLAEAWFDTELGIYTNLAPPSRLVRAHPGRFELHVLDHDDIVSSLKQLHETLARHAKQPQRLLVTVSPVPLASTFRDQDVLVANSYSKAVQRAAVETFVARHEAVDYFPSYEFVTLSAPEMAWTREDYRHVAGHAVRHIMAHVLAAYVEDTEVPELSFADLEHRARAYLDLSNMDGVIGVLEPHPDMVLANVPLMMMLARAYRRVGHNDRAFDLFSRVRDKDPGRPVPLEAMIGLGASVGFADRIADWLAEHEKQFPKRVEFREKFTGP